LTTAYIPQTVEDIRQRAFSECTALKNFNLPDNLKKLGSSAFYKTAVLGIVIPETLEELGYASFSFSKLKSAIYMGNKSFEGPAMDFCTGCYDLKSVCLNPDYNLTHFTDCCADGVLAGCNHPINLDNCDTYRSFYSICNKAEYKAGQVNKVQREETIEWEKKTAENICYSYTCDDKKGFVEEMSTLAKGWIAKGKDDHCMEYNCINGTGNVRWSACNTTDSYSRLCMGTCTTNWEPTLKYWVDIVLDNNTSYLGESLDLRMIIANLGNVKHGEITVYYKMDEYGNCLSVIVKVKDEKSGNAIKAGVEGIKKQTPCRYELLCHWNQVIVHAPKKDSSSAAGQGSNGSVSIHGLSSVMTFLLVLIAMFMN